jgi:hypothetical protein
MQELDKNICLYLIRHIGLRDPRIVAVAGVGVGIFESNTLLVTSGMLSS